MDEQTELVPRATIETIVTLRNVALKKYDDAYVSLVRASQDVAAAKKAALAASPGINSYNYHSAIDRDHFLFKLEVAEYDKFTATARKLTDIDTWSYIIGITQLESIMDKEEKDRLRDALHHDPPEITVENVYATLERFRMDSNLIWKRGLANSFSKLDRRFRSHTGWKIGSRIILQCAFDERGHWSYYRNHSDTLIDIERAFFILDGLKPPDRYYGILTAIDAARRGGWGKRQTYVESEFFRMRIWKNGNCHIWFQRDDLVEKANKVLAEYYGEVIPDGTDQQTDESDLFSPKTTPAKNYGHFPTPEDIAQTAISGLYLYKHHKDDPPFTVLEPSAGEGNLARLAAEKGTVVDCVEIQPHLACQLQDSGLYRRVICRDFLQHRPHPDMLYDRVVMNPPFDLERDIDHVIHAMDFLKPHGCLLAIMSAATEFRETKKSRAFRDKMNGLHAYWRDLPPGSFSSVGTNVNTLIMRVWKDGQVQGYWR